MIAQANRFHGHNSLSMVYRKGQTVSLGLASLKHLPIRTGKKYRLAVVVSRKVDKSAVVRNRIRRRVYEAMREKYPKFNKNVDIVITIHNNQLATMKSSEFNDLIDQLLIKSSLINN
ncbi:MAG: ribonuclease P protein component [Candidatus Saccharibacteria bacterium]